MYQTIEKNKFNIVNFLKSKSSHFHDYLQLIKGLNSVTTEYQKSYKHYWGMNPARLSNKFHETYFELLLPTYNNLDLIEVVNRLYEVTSNEIGAKSFQVSFTTKLLHMKNRNLPIIDKYISEFFGLGKYYEISDATEKTKTIITDYSFLKKEYSRILSEKLLDQTIAEVKKLENVNQISDIKIIDSIIWAWQSMISERQVVNGKIKFQ